MTRDLVRDGSIESMPIGDRKFAGGAFILLYPSSRQVPKKVTAFRDFLVERLKAPSWVEEAGRA